MTLPPRDPSADTADKEKRFFVFASQGVILALQTEAVSRGLDAWRLGGAVITQWIEAGCPDAIQPRTVVQGEQS